ncbi:murein L,D-transpeptidase family protein [Sulfurovum sp.]|uniref:murein L,D-transpeptidase family protein n=1 Tax=Sulfurovum sp. TaxID=1969726 RepID=UPI002867FB6B|nr:murein L,D-transpeptidase family protein [Sulfurovum sp.]
MNSLMTKAWLILLDTLLYIVLIISLILFHLYPVLDKQTDDEKLESAKLSHFEENATLSIYSSSTLDFNDKITLNDLMRMGQECANEEYYIKNKFITRTLEEGLTELAANIGDPVFIRIFKKEALLEVWIRTGTAYEHLKDYAICAYSGYLGPKLQEGDRQAPEGFYKVKKYQLNPNSKYHLSFNLGYPNKYDREHNRTGSFLMVHGSCVSDGCYAMTDDKIAEIYALVEGSLQKGQKYVQVHAYPFSMTEENMNFYDGSEWYDFWMNLKEGYDYFEAERLPPLIKVKDKLYIIHESDEY